LVDDVHEYELEPYAPTVAQWARAEAFGVAVRLWARVGMGNISADDLQDMELLALRWAQIIESGEIAS
jgi:hypothetical protein